MTVSQNQRRTRKNTNRNEKAVGWMSAAACKGSDPDLFFPESLSPSIVAGKQKEAKEICNQCPVEHLCLEYALENYENERNSIWGGKTDKERRKLRRERRTAI